MIADNAWIGQTMAARCLLESLQISYRWATPGAKCHGVALRGTAVGVGLRATAHTLQSFRKRIARSIDGNSTNTLPLPRLTHLRASPRTSYLSLTMARIF